MWFGGAGRERFYHEEHEGHEGREEKGLRG
jgi:hypothetical protein